MPRSRHNRYAHEIQDARLRELVPRHLRGAVLDLGCGTKPYASLLSGTASWHVGVDRPDMRHDAAEVDVMGLAERLPFRDQSFEGILATNVLEHVRHPEAVLAECFRVLRPGGGIVLTTPFMWHIHEAPADHYRFTEFALRAMMSDAGFADAEVSAASGFWGTFGQLLAYQAHRHSKLRPRLAPIFRPLSTFAQRAGGWLDRRDQDPRWTFLYFSSARKPGAPKSAELP